MNESLLQTVSHIECIFVGSCNLSCEYCCIHKNPKEMHSYNNTIRKAIKDQTFQNNIKKQFETNKEHITGLSLWSGEPTLNADLAETFLEPLLDFFPNLTDFMFSTNAILGYEKGIAPYIKFFHRYAEQHQRVIKLLIQFSLDGPAEYTNKTRNYPNAAEIITQTIHNTVKATNTYCKNYFQVEVTTKPTVPAHFWPYMLEGNNLLNWYKFFNKLTAELVEIIEPDTKIRLCTAQEPTLVTPYDYTKEDGINFAKLIHKMKEIDIKEIPEYSHPLIYRFERCYHGTMGMNNCYGTEFRCGAGVGSIAIDYQGHMILCHRLYDNFRMGGEASPFQELYSITNEKELARIDYTNASFESNLTFINDNLSALLHLMIKAGEIDPKYSQYDYINLILSFAGGIVCFCGECGAQTHCHHLVPASTIRLLCNGALEELIQYYAKY